MKTRKSVFSLVIVLALAATGPGFTAKKLFLTTNTQSSGPSVRPGFNFRFVWNALGQGKNGCIYLASGDESEEVAGGDNCLVEFNPATNTMRSLGTVVEAYKANGNWVSGEYCNKVHTWFCGTGDGKVWFGTEDGGQGGHLMYVDQANGSRIEDYGLMPGYSLKTLSINPYAPRYVWTESFDNYYFQCWDIQTNTKNSLAGGQGDLRVILSDKSGNMWYSNGGFAYKRSPNGTTKLRGRGLGYTPSAYVYTHSYDSAFTIVRGEGRLEMYDFTRDTVVPLVDFPDNSGCEECYRAITISRDDKSLYMLGNGGVVYQITIATGQYQEIGSLSAVLAGNYAFSSGTMDSLGNWYLCAWSGVNGQQPYLIQVNLGRDAISPLPIPDGTAVEIGNAGLLRNGEISVSPNPFSSSVRIHGAGISRAGIFDVNGRCVAVLAKGEGAWNAGGAAAGVYYVRVRTDYGVNQRRMVLLR